MTIQEILAKCTGFEWDDDNVDKNWAIHRVAFWECEEVIFNEPVIVAKDVKHSLAEQGFYALGQTNGKRLLFVVLTVRGNLIRVISARDMTRKEKKVYQTYEE